MRNISRFNPSHYIKHHINLNSITGRGAQNRKKRKEEKSEKGGVLIQTLSKEVISPQLAAQIWQSPPESFHQKPFSIKTGEREREGERERDRQTDRQRQRETAKLRPQGCTSSHSATALNVT